jgi:hypothetical protein
MSISASQVVLQFEGVDDQLHTLQCDLDDVDYGGTSAITKKETFCAVTKVKGNPDIAISVTGVYTDDADGAWDVFYDLWHETDQTRLYKFGPAGSATGQMLLSGESYLTEYHIKETAGGDVSISAKFEVDGNDHRSTW